MSKTSKKNVNKVVVVNNSMQNRYRYTRTMSVGDMSDHPEFNPEYTPCEMLKMGVFEGNYLDLRSFDFEFPYEWYKVAKIKLNQVPSAKLYNFFGVKSRLPLSEWRKKGWIHKDDPRGWFEWYCRFYMGRRHEDDVRQIARWRSFGPRHTGAIRKHCPANGNRNSPNLQKRRRQRQALLQWSWNPFV